MSPSEVIVFANLRQRTNVVGEYSPVSAKAQPFVASNAKGSLRQVTEYNQVGDLAKQAGVEVKKMLLPEVKKMLLPDAGM